MKIFIEKAFCEDSGRVILFAAENGATIVCLDTDEIAYVLRRAKEFHLSIEPPIHFLQFLKESGGSKKNYVFRDVGKILASLTPKNKILAIAAVEE